MFGQLKTLLADNSEALSLIGSIESKYNALADEATKSEQKINDLIASRDKYKNFSKNIKAELGFSENDELTLDKVKEKLGTVKENVKQESNEAETALKNDLLALQKEFESYKANVEEEKKSFKQKSIEKKIDVALLETTQGIKAVNKKAHELIVSELKKNVYFDEDTGSIVYRNEDGTTMRHNGTPISVVERLNQIQESEDFSFLFASDAKSGSGIQTATTQTKSVDGSDFAKRFAERAKKMGIKV